jgi:hypothetical protein
MENGSVWGAGYGFAGTLGENAHNAENPSFVQIFPGDAKAVAAGSEHSLILTNAGTVYASGGNGFGQLGFPNATSDIGYKAFTQALDSSGQPLTDVTAIAAGNYFSLALKSDGTLWMSGENGYGQLGIQYGVGLPGSADYSDRFGFTQVAEGVKAISAGRNHAQILKTDGTTVTFGIVDPAALLASPPSGSGAFIIRVEDPFLSRFINNTAVYIGNGDIQIFGSSEVVATGGIGLKVNVPPGIYRVELRTNNNPSVPQRFLDTQVAANETVSILYRNTGNGVPPAYIYEWVVTRSLP